MRQGSAPDIRRGTRNKNNRVIAAQYAQKIGSASSAFSSVSNSVSQDFQKTILNDGVTKKQLINIANQLL